MSGETNLKQLIKNLSPYLNEGEYVFVSVLDDNEINSDAIIFKFKETEGVTLIINKENADALNLKYEFVASWVTLKVHSSLNAVGLTAVVSTELAKHQISCNMVAGYYHDHLFVNIKDANKTMWVLEELPKNY